MPALCFIKTYVVEAGPEVSLPLLARGLSRSGARVYIVEIDLARHRVFLTSCDRRTILRSFPLPRHWSPRAEARIAERVARLLDGLQVGIVDCVYNKKCIGLYHALQDRLPGRAFVLRFLCPPITDDHSAPGCLRTLRERARFSSLVGRMNACVALSRSIARAVSAVCGKPLRHLVVVPDAVAAVVRPAAVRAPRAPRFLFAGRFEPSKGPDLLLFAFRDLLTTHPRARLTLCGHGRLRGTLRAMVVSMRMAAAVRILPWQPHRAVLRRIDRSSAVVVPSRAEPFGRPVIEAQSRGVPVVATRVGGIPELVRTGQDGLLVPPEPSALCAALRAVTDDMSLRRRLVARGLRRAARYRLERVVRIHREVYARAYARAHG